MAKTKAQIIAEAQVVKNATEVGENTATRVGGVLEDLADADSVVIIPVTGTESGGNITFSSNPFTQVQTAVNAGQHAIVRVSVGNDVVDFSMNTYSDSVSTYIGVSKFLQQEFQMVCTASGTVVNTINTSNTFSTGESVPNVGIDDVPTQGSDNLVKSGGVWEIGSEKTVVETADIELRNTIINASGNWINPSRYRHIIIPVTEGVTVMYTADSGYLSYYAFLTSDAAPVNGTPAPLVPGTTRTLVEAGNTASFVIPEGTKFLYLNSGDVNSGTSHARDYLPEYVTFYKTLDSRLSASEAMGVKLEDTIKEKTLDLSLYKVRNGSVSASNTWSNAARYYHILIPVIMGDTVTLLGNATHSTYYGYLMNDVQAQTGANAPVVENTTRMELPANNTIEVSIPEGCRYLYIYSGDLNSGISHIRDYLPTEVRLKSSVGALLEVISNAGILYDGGIIAANPDTEWLGKMVAAKKRYYTSSITDKPEPVVIAHISDIHANWSNVRRFIEFTRHHNVYIDGLLNTGDTAAGLFTDGIYHTSVLGDDVNYIMNVVGNHDTRGTDGWQQYVGTSIYEKLIAPYISYWDVVQPADAAANGYCYYYKDYTAQSLRLIVVDIMGYDATEDAWLASVLADARSNGYHVVIATHFAGGRDSEHQAENAFNVMACNYSTLQITSGNASGLYGYNSLAYMMTPTVKSFIDNGGIFVGYIQGHYHLDFVAQLAEDSRQLIYAIGSSKVGETRDYNHVGATRMQDEFQIISIDTFKNTIRLFKVGANIDEFGREKNSICVNYLTQTIIAEGY